MKLRIIGIVTLLTMAILSSACSVTNKSTVCLPDTPQHSATKAEDRMGWWGKRHFGVLERIKQGPVDLLMIGDSITHGWENTGKALWEEYYTPRNAANLGFSGDRTQHVLWRFDHGEIDNISPKAAVIMIGTNNSNGTDNTAEEIADGIIAIVKELRTKLPETKILILAIFPRKEGPCPQREKNDRASLLASRIADGKMIHYLNINQRFLTENGTLSKDIMPDHLHPNAQGYAIWADAMESKIKELMGEE